MNGFEIREATYTAEVRGQSVAYHDLFLFQDKLQVELSLNTSADAYDTYLSDFRAIAGSIRPANTGTTHEQR